MIEDILQPFGIKSEIKKIKLNGMPLFMSQGRKFYQVQAQGMSFLLVEISSLERFGAVALEKQLSVYKEKSQLEVAYSFRTLTKLQRDALIERQIPFVSGDKQLYLPFIGAYLSNAIKNKKSIVYKKMTPATQCLFLYMLYNKDAEYTLKSQAASTLHLTRTSMTRAAEQLKAMELITEENVGKEIHMKTVSKGRELYEKAKEFLITPVKKTIYLEYDKAFENEILAGETALSKNTMLSEPQYPCFAMFKDDERIKKMTEVDPQWQEDLHICQVEIWKYSPLLFAQGSCVDIVSLALSLKENIDERVQGELEDYMEAYKW